MKYSVVSSELTARCCVRLLKRTASDDLPSRNWATTSSHIEWNRGNASVGVAQKAYRSASVVLLAWK